MRHAKVSSTISALMICAHRMLPRAHRLGTRRVSSR